MTRLDLFPPIEPYAVSKLQVSDLHTIAFEEAGNAAGKPALFLHGGPGVGILPDYRRFFDPEFYHIVLPDQRGAGRSTPHAETRENTTWHIVEDLEKLRNHLKIDKWLVMGGSWGSTLALCYAITYPKSVTGLILRGIFLARPLEERWLHRAGGASQLFPDEWEKFLAPLAEADRDNPTKAYYEILTGGDEERRLAAARAWTRWEAFTMTLVPNPQTFHEMIDDYYAISIGCIECHYTVNDFFMKSDNFILENAGALREIPCRIVQGRYDIICPMVSAWELHHALPASELLIIPDGAHSPMDAGMIDGLIRASEAFKSL
ncbi:MAG: prolyl aminopeptidase [Candidatus Latescibacterota bacterium]